MPMAPPNASGIELAYEVFGDPDDVPLLFIMGLGAQLVVWDTEFIESFVDRGFYAIRYDNRDVGLSTKPDVGEVDVVQSILAALGGQDVQPPYTLSDMAGDAAGLLDHLGIPAAHVVGASMGGMIAQALAIEHPDRVLSLTSVMSTTGDPDVGQPDPSILGTILRHPPTTRDEAIQAGIEGTRAIAGGDSFDEERARARAAASYDRDSSGRGIGHHLMAVVLAPSRAEGLRGLDVPTLVVHGDADPLVTPSGGIRTAELVPGAELMMIEGMGHDIAPPFWPQIVEGVTRLAARAASARI